MDKKLTPITREEKILHALATETAVPIAPVTRNEKLIAAMIDGSNIDFVPATREEYFLDQVLRIKQPHALVEFISGYGQVMLSTVYTIYDTINFPVGPSKIGYSFESWDMDETAIKDAIQNGETSIEVHALYTESPAMASIHIKYEGVNRDDETTEAKPISQSIQVVAPDIDGYQFAEWKLEDGTSLSTNSTYYIMTTSDKTLVAKYVEAGEVVAQKAVVALTGVTIMFDGGKKKMAYIATRSVPDEYQVVENGQILSTADKYGNDDWKDTFIIDGERVGKYKSGVNDNDGFFTRTTVINDNQVDMTLYGRGYVIVKDQSENQQVIYSDNRFAYSFNDLVEN